MLFLTDKFKNRPITAVAGYAFSDEWLHFQVGARRVMAQGVREVCR